MLYEIMAGMHIKGHAQIVFLRRDGFSQEKPKECRYEDKQPPHQITCLQSTHMKERYGLSKSLYIAHID